MCLSFLRLPVRKKALEESAKMLQRGFRRLRQRWQQGRKMDFAAVVRAVKGQRRVPRAPNTS